MGTVVPKLVDEVFGVENIAVGTDWCQMVMVRADYQGKGIAKAMVEMEFERVSTCAAARFLRSSFVARSDLYFLSTSTGCERGRDRGGWHHEREERESRL